MYVYCVHISECTRDKIFAEFLTGSALHNPYEFLSHIYFISNKNNNENW